jgi:hypothetical protein
MSAASASSFDFVAVLKYGAIGISLVCLLTAFWANQSLARRAGEIPEETLATLLTHAKWTMKYSFACLLAAILIEGVSHFYVPITVRIGVVPANLDSDVQRIRSVKVDGDPVWLQVAADPKHVELKNGSGEIKVTPNATVVVYVDGIWSVVKDLDGLAYGQQQRALDTAGGTLEPRQ